ncbi:hypothetical protein ACHABQ_03080 [Nesterenkonia aurantiaca]|uniref:hypothetical protein n=1 Tax=Nesterenkonia aurantiaca TaxID=1436010 RepID=UPI003EE7F6A7
MPETITASGYEKRIAEFVWEHGVVMRRRAIQRMSIQIVRRIERMSDTDRERLVMHSDPVPCEALHHILGSTPCKRCGQAPKALTV